ncbi:MAG TPA: lytic transglycosylase domain-containing protein [Thermoanaerobaculia bacterium]
MKHQRLKVPFKALSTILFLALAIQPTPSDPAVIDLRQMHVDDHVKLQELADWAAGPRAQGIDLRVLHPADLAAATSFTHRRFQLFSHGASTEEQRRFLRDLPYGPAMALAAERHRVDGLLVAAIVETESGFVSNRVSPQGAVGLMQILPSTAEDYGAKDLLDPRVNLDVGSRYLGELLTDFKGDLELAVAAYNAGPGTVERYGGVPPYRETKDYVKRVLTLYGEHHQTAGRGTNPFLLPSDRFGG